MTGVDTSGRAIVKLKPGRKKKDSNVDLPPLLRGSPPQLRGLWAKHLIFQGVHPREVRDIIGVSKAQLYRYLKLARQALADAIAEMDDAEAA
jgi:hypothetical protein